MKQIKRNSRIMALLVAVLILCTGTEGYAASNTGIQIKETAVSVQIGETITLDVAYQAEAGKAVSLGVVSADETLAAVQLADAGNGKALLSIGGLRAGSCVVAVYEASDPKSVDYVTVRCGLAKEGGVYTVNEGNAFTTVYDDVVIHYNSLMQAKNKDQLAIEQLEVERNSGIDALLVEGKLWTENNSQAGLLTFYVNFYNASGELMERMPYYMKNTGPDSKASLCWYIPRGCTEIVVE